MTEEKTDTPCLCHECSIIPKVQLSMAAALARKFDAEMMAGKGADRSFIPARESDIMYIAELERRLEYETFEGRFKQLRRAWMDFKKEIMIAFLGMFGGTK